MHYTLFPCQSQKKKLPIVFCHGYATTSSYFAKVAKALSANHDVYLLELEGMGVVPARNPKKLSPSFYAEQIVQFMRHEFQKTQAILIGHSMGGGTSILAAYHLKDKLACVIPICPMNSFIHWKLINAFRIIPKNLKQVARLENLLYHNPREYETQAIALELAKKELSYFKEITKDQKQLFKKISGLKNILLLHKAERNNQVPTYLIVAEHDRIIDARSAIRNYSKNKLVKCYTIKDAGHNVFVDEFEKTTQIIQDICLSY